LQEVAAVYRSVGMWPDAERWLRTLSERFPDQSEPLALHLLEVDAAEQAIRLCLEQLESTDSAYAANLLARVLLQADVSTDTRQRVLSRLDDSLTRFPENGSLLFTAGNVRLKLGLIEEAFQLLRRATEVQPGHYLAWNNLAALLAERPADRDEAMRTIERAMEMAGYALPTLLDTKAVVLLNQGRYAEAAELLARVTQSRQVNDPRYYFHHATALDELGRRDAAREALAEANNLGLSNAFLTRAERDELDRLQRRYPLENNEAQTY
jgi:tetratricopeptide (TPR) repeat protein